VITEGGRVEEETERSADKATKFGIPGTDIQQYELQSAVLAKYQKNGTTS